MILPGLREIQKRCGFLPMSELHGLSERLGVPLHRIQEVVSFFPHFRREPPPPLTISVCRDMACHLRNAGACHEALSAEAAALGGVEQIEVEWVSCLGRCDGAPAAIATRHRAGEHDAFEERLCLTPSEAAAWLRGMVVESPHVEAGHARRPPMWSIDPYDQRNGEIEESPIFAAVTPGEPYRAVKGFASELRGARTQAAWRETGEKLLAALKTAELRGMGGAGVPAARKWQDVRDARGEPKYVICNADESEPCTFKDREILLHAPHLIIEGMTLAALLVGASQGYVYIRHEYFDQIHAMEHAIEQARVLGVIGANVLETGCSFELEVFESPGGYVCGEQGALIEAIEEHRAEPRNKPPQIETNGLFDRPTLLNNVETLAWVPAIALRGGAWYADAGVRGSEWYVARKKAGAKGLRLFSICGDVERPGVYEMPIGATLGELIDRAGGIAGGRTLLAVAPSGPSGGFVPARLARSHARELARVLGEGQEFLDICALPLDIDEFRGVGMMLGAGLMVLAERPELDMLDQALNATRFFRNESCGKCVPCRIGSQKLVEIGEGLVQGPGLAGDLGDTRALVEDLHRTLELTSICGLGMSAAKPLASVLHYFANYRIR